MLRGHKIVLVMPAYNAARTLLPTHQEIMALGLVDRVVVVDDASGDDTAAVAEHLPDTTFHRHPRNRGYGGNQKTCYQLALDEGADIVVMVHPDYQYTPLLPPSLCELLCSGLFDVGIGSRILVGEPWPGGCRCGDTFQIVSSPWPRTSLQGPNFPNIIQATELSPGDCRGNGFRVALTIHLSKVIRISQRLQEINSVRCYL